MRASSNRSRQLRVGVGATLLLIGAAALGAEPAARPDAVADDAAAGLQPELLVDVLAAIGDPDARVARLFTEARSRGLLWEGRAAIEEESFIPSVQVARAGELSVVAVSDYRSFGSVAFLDEARSRFVYEDLDLPVGVGSVEVHGVPAGTGVSAVVEVVHPTLFGTGAFAESTRVYVVAGDEVTHALAVPSFEYNSGWGAFEAAHVEFAARMDLDLDPASGRLRLTRRGVAKALEFDAPEEGALFETEGGAVTAFLPLPEEVYLLDAEAGVFVQVEGRSTAEAGLMTSLYSDLLSVRGDWFTRPEDVEREGVAEFFD